MKKFIYFICICTFLCMSFSIIYAMPSLDFIKEYEQNLVDYAENGEWVHTSYFEDVVPSDLSDDSDEEIVYSDKDDSELDKPAGYLGLDNIKYYISSSNSQNIYQIYETSNYTYIVSWVNNKIDTVEKFEHK